MSTAVHGLSAASYESCDAEPPGVPSIGYDKWSLAMMPYGKLFRSQRRLFLGKFSTPAAMRAFHDAQRTVGLTFLARVLRDPDNIFRHFKL